MQTLNDTIFFFLYSFAHQSVLMDNLIIFIADIFPYIVIVLAILFLFFHHDVLPSRDPIKEFLKKWKEIVFVFLSGILAWLLSLLLKALIQMSRPFTVFPQVHSLFVETGYAFPSGHATFFSALAVTIFLFHKKAGWWFIFFALIIGIARIAAGVHFPIDILGGFILGTGIAFFLKNV